MEMRDVKNKGSCQKGTIRMIGREGPRATEDKTKHNSIHVR